MTNTQASSASPTTQSNTATPTSGGRGNFNGNFNYGSGHGNGYGNGPNFNFPFSFGGVDSEYDREDRRSGQGNAEDSQHRNGMWNGYGGGWWNGNFNGRGWGSDNGNFNGNSGGAGNGNFNGNRNTGSGNGNFNGNGNTGSGNGNFNGDGGNGGNGGNGYGGDGGNGGNGGNGYSGSGGNGGNECTQCLSTLSSLTVNSLQNDTRSPLTCQHYARLYTQIKQDEASSNSKFTDDQFGFKTTADSNYAFLNGEIKKFCSSSNPCDSSTSIKGYKQILNDCATELSSNNNLVIQYFLDYYFASPHYANLCMQSSVGGYAWKQIGNLEFDYINKNFSKNDSSLYIRAYEFPPQPKIDISYSNPNHIDSTVKVPASILCNDDYKKVSNIYIDYVGKNPVDSKYASLISVVDNLKSNLTATSCSNVDVASSSKEVANGTSSSNGGSSGVGIRVEGIVGVVVLGILTSFVLPFF
ncbi:3313_t:CDS:2 [Ambispora leptoticha]|uniref:3313_t:CDS:1 n=1 Tax=Ambispora leptoticha TaxID=144679 RepID=A0A9N8ZSN2_9GLOM|nr:3313_t:CDS:2 [Ambispora leptoticha]